MTPSRGIAVGIALLLLTIAAFVGDIGLLIALAGAGGFAIVGVGVYHGINNRDGVGLTHAMLIGCMGGIVMVFATVLSVLAELKGL